MKSSLFLPISGLAALLLFTGCPKQAESTSQGNPLDAAYRSNANIAGYFDLAALHNSPLSQTLSKQFKDDRTEAVKNSLNVKDEDVKEFAFSVSGLEEDSDNPVFSSLLRISKPITLDQIEQVIRANANEHNINFEKRNIDGITALVFQNEDGEDAAAMTSIVKGNETFLAIATPTALGDIVNNKNQGGLPTFAKEASAKLTEKGQGFATIRLTKEMKESLKEAGEEASQGNPMGFQIPVDLTRNLHNLNSTTLGISITDKAVFELQGIFDNDAQATAFSNGLGQLLPMIQMMAGFAFASSQDGPPPVLPAFSQEAKNNAVSFKLTLTQNEAAKKAE